MEGEVLFEVAERRRDLSHGHTESAHGALQWCEVRCSTRSKGILLQFPPQLNRARSETRRGVDRARTLQDGFGDRASDVDYRKTKTYFRSLLFLPMGYTTFVKAAEIYRALRRKGVTVRRPVDCMIAATAIEHDVLLLHNDRDFNAIEKDGGLKVLDVAGGPMRA